MYKKANEQIRNIKEVNEEIFHRDYCNARLNALFLSNVMQDLSSMHSLIHRKKPAGLPVLKAFADYYEHRDAERLTVEIEELNNQYPGLNNFHVIKDENGQKVLMDNTKQKSNWFDLDNYDTLFSLSIEDKQVFPHRHKSFKDESAISIINDTIDFLKNPAYSHPHTSDEQLNLMFTNLYYGQELDEDAYFKTLTMLNTDIIKTYNRQKSTLEEGHVDGIMMMEDLSTELFRNIDYPRQFSFYKTPLCREMLKLSYLTTFIKKHPFDEEDMNTYLDHIQSSGHWLQAHRRITNTINKESMQLTGINYGMMALSTPRPLKEPNSMLNKYRQRDLERIMYQEIYLGKEL